MNDSKKQQDHLDDVDRVLEDVREHLNYTKESGEIYELRALQLLLQVTKALHRQHDIHALMTLVLDSALSFAEADRAFLLLVKNGELRFKMGRSYERAYLTEADCMISSSVITATLDNLKPIILMDAQTDAIYSTRQSIQDLQLRTIMAAPMRIEDRLLGVIYVDSQRPLGRYSKHHLNVMTSLAEQAAVAIHNARKFETHPGPPEQ